jgi:hypothetical protein
MLRTLALALLLAVAVTAPASAATKNGITPLAPKAGSSVPAGKSPVFRFRSTGQGPRWVHVCKRKKKDKAGIICHKAEIGQAKKKNGVYEYKPKFYDFPEFWLNTRGTYYWQAHRIDCNSKDCQQEGPIVKFKVA